MALLHKYRHFSNRHHLRIVSDGELRFAPPLEFNDPHDCRIPIQWAKANRTWLEAEIRDQARRQDPVEDESKREAKVQEELTVMLNSDRRKLLLEYQTRKFVSPKIGVLSFYLDSANPLLWAHYSESHAGFSVGFDRSRLLDTMKSISGVAY